MKFSFQEKGNGDNKFVIDDILYIYTCNCSAPEGKWNMPKESLLVGFFFSGVGKSVEMRCISYLIFM